MVYLFLFRLIGSIHSTLTALLFQVVAPIDSSNADVLIRVPCRGCVLIGVVGLFCVNNGVYRYRCRALKNWV